MVLSNRDKRFVAGNLVAKKYIDRNVNCIVRPCKFNLQSYMQIKFHTRSCQLGQVYRFVPGNDILRILK